MMIIKVLFALFFGAAFGALTAVIDHWIDSGKGGDPA